MEKFFCKTHKEEERRYAVRKNGEIIFACPKCRRILEMSYGPLDKVEAQIPKIRDIGYQPWQDRKDM